MGTENHEVSPKETDQKIEAFKNAYSKKINKNCESECVNRVMNSKDTKRGVYKSIES